jgi:DNA-binding GntR family transcriptional regulator
MVAAARAKPGKAGSPARQVQELPVRRQALRWQDVRNRLLGEIRTMNVGDRLDSVEQLGARLGCSERPVNRALEWLGAQGYLALRRGTRAQLVTNQPHGVLGLGGLREFGDELEVVSGRIYSVDVASSALARMAAEVLKAPPGTPLAVVDRVRRLRPSKSRPQNAVRWDRSFMIASQVGDLWTVDFSKPAPGLLRSQERANLRPVLEEVTLAAALASQEEAAKLGLLGKGPAAVLTVVRKSYDTNRKPTEYLLVVSHDWTVQQFSHTPRTGPEASFSPRGVRLLENAEAERRALHGGAKGKRARSRKR